jgi:hypothetical protein
LFVASLALLVGACAAPQKFDWFKDGASDFERETARSECSYQIKLNKTALVDQAELLNLCMKGKGFRFKPVS